MLSICDLGASLVINDLAIKPPPPPVVKNPPTNAQDPGTIPGPGRSHKIPHGATRAVPHNY